MDLSSMMAILERVGQAGGLVVGFFRNMSAADSAAEYLEDKYGFTPSYVSSISHNFNAGECKTYDAHEGLLNALITRLLSRSTMSDSTRELCGDIAITVFVLKVNSDHPWKYGGLYKSETWRTLHSLGRGLGSGSYALKLVQKELRAWRARYS